MCLFDEFMGQFYFKAKVTAFLINTGDGKMDFESIKTLILSQ